MTVLTRDARCPNGIRVFLAYTMDETGKAVKKVVLKAAKQCGVEIVLADIGSSSDSPAEHVRALVDSCDALLAVFQGDRQWIHNEIGIGFAYHLPIFVLCSGRPPGIIPGITSAGSFSLDLHTITRSVVDGLGYLKSAVVSGNRKLPEPPDEGHQVLRISWRRFSSLVEEVYNRLTLDVTPQQGGFQPSLVLGVSRGGIMVGDILARRSWDTRVGLLDVVRTGRTLYVSYEVTRAILRQHKQLGSNPPRILIVDDSFKTGRTMERAYRTVCRAAREVWGKKMRPTQLIKTLALIVTGESITVNRTRLPHFYAVKDVSWDSASILLPYGRG